MSKHGGTSIGFKSATKPELVEGLHCTIPIDGVAYSIEIIAHPKKERNYDSEIRRIWRVLFFHLKAVFESVDSGVLEFREVMLPYIVTHDGRTVGQHILPKLKDAVTGTPERMLPAPRT